MLNNKSSWFVFACFLLLIGLSTEVDAQSFTLTIERCRALALENNKGYKVANEKVAESDELRKMALSQFFPKVSANAVYLYNTKNLELINGDQQRRLNNMGTSLVDDVMADIPSVVSGSGIDAIRTLLNNRIGMPLNDIGREITEALDIDIHNVFVGGVTVYQPIYMGGKLRALYKAAASLADIAELQSDKAREDLIISVDEAYWRVISLQQKCRLAQQYSDLLDTLEYQVSLMVDAEVATVTDLAKVKVKHNEARMTLTKATGGLRLAKMMVYQLCGLSLDGEYAFEEPLALQKPLPVDKVNMTEVFARRNELRQLRLAANVSDAGVMAARSLLLPNLGVQASYLFSNPNVFNGVQHRFDGMFSIGAVLNIPIAHPSAIFSLRAAKHRRRQVQYQLEDAQEMISLQVKKLNYELEVANAKLSQAESGVALADESLRFAQESFAAGVISSSDLMQVQTAWMQANSDRLDAAIEARVVSLYLRQALGE